MAHTTAAPHGSHAKRPKQSAPQKATKEAGGSEGTSSKGREKKRRRDDTSSVEKGNSATTSNGDSAHRPSKKPRGNQSAAVVDLTSELDLTSIVNDEPELPAEVGTLAANYDVTEMNIISSSKMEAKVTKVLETLAKFSFIPPCKPNIIYLHAKAPCAAKLISILEIAKRTIAEKKGKWYQYNQLGEVKEEREREIMSGNAMAIDEEGPADSTDFRFETMKTPFERATEGKPKVRAVPVLGIYLSRVRVESLNKQYGEQTNALK